MLRRRGGASWAYLLLLVPVLAVIFPPIYAGFQPAWAGIPFFIWYQLLWTILGALVVAAVYLIQGSDDEASTSSSPGGAEDELTPP